MQFGEEVIKLKDSIKNAIVHNVDLTKEIDKEKELIDFGQKRQNYHRSILENALRVVKSNSIELTKLVKHDICNQEGVNQILELVPELDSKDLGRLRKTAEKLLILTKQLEFPKEEIEKTFFMPKTVPLDITSDIKADINELNKCFNNECFRSTIILCGRLLETALHRKYFEVTGNDLLEKSPGIGLGNIIAKLKDKEVVLDPGLTNQIHLINQVRVFSVHKKKDAFFPSKQQTQAMVLYTLDILEKLF